MTCRSFLIAASCALAASGAAAGCPDQTGFTPFTHSDLGADGERYWVTIHRDPGGATIERARIGDRVWTQSESHAGLLNLRFESPDGRIATHEYGAPVAPLLALEEGTRHEIPFTFETTGLGSQGLLIFEIGATRSIEIGDCAVEVVEIRRKRRLGSYEGDVETLLYAPGLQLVVGLSYDHDSDPATAEQLFTVKGLTDDPDQRVPR